MTLVKLPKAEVGTGISPLCSMVNVLHMCQEISEFSVFRVLVRVGCWVEILPPFAHHLPYSLLDTSHWGVNLQLLQQQNIQ